MINFYFEFVGTPFIETVTPEQVDDLKIQAGQDLCTLVTCTPYGINTHRLLVRGHRVENAKELTHISAEAARRALQPEIEQETQRKRYWQRMTGKPLFFRILSKIPRGRCRQFYGYEWGCICV